MGCIPGQARTSIAAAYSSTELPQRSRREPQLLEGTGTPSRIFLLLSFGLDSMRPTYLKGSSFQLSVSLKAAYYSMPRPQQRRLPYKADQMSKMFASWPEAPQRDEEIKTRQTPETLIMAQHMLATLIKVQPNKHARSQGNNRGHSPVTSRGGGHPARPGDCIPRIAPQSLSGSVVLWPHMRIILVKNSRDARFSKRAWLQKASINAHSSGFTNFGLLHVPAKKSR